MQRFYLLAQVTLDHWGSTAAFSFPRRQRRDPASEGALLPQRRHFAKSYKDLEASARVWRDSAGHEGDGNGDTGLPTAASCSGSSPANTSPAIAALPSPPHWSAGTVLGTFIDRLCLRACSALTLSVMATSSSASSPSQAIQNMGSHAPHKLVLHQTEASDETATPRSGDDPNLPLSRRTPLLRLEVAAPALKPRQGDAALTGQQRRELFADAFAITLHRTAAHWQRVAIDTTSPTSATMVMAATLVCCRPVFQCNAHRWISQLRGLESSFLAICSGLCSEAEEAALPRSGSESRQAVLRREVAALFHAIEERTRATGRALGPLRQHPIAAPPRPKRGGRGAKGAVVTAGPVLIRETLQHALERVGLELHLVHLLLVRLSRGKASTATAMAACGSFSSSADAMEWLLATELLRSIFGATYRFHRIRQPAKKGSHAESREAEGLVQLLSMAVGELLDSGIASTATPDDSTPSTVPLQGALLRILSLYYSILPYSVALLHDLPVGSSATTPNTTLAASAMAAAGGGIVAHAESVFGDEEDHGSGEEQRRLTGPLRLLDEMLVHWTKHEAQVRSSGASAAMWWLQLLPLYLSTITSAVNLRLALAAVEPSKSSHVVGGVDKILRKSSDMLQHLLRFEREDYERSQGAAASTQDEQDMDGAGSRATPPPLPRHRGKRSLFYKSNQPESAILRENHLAGSAAADKGSRFTSRHQGYGASKAPLGDAGGRDRTSSSATGRLQTSSGTSALFDVLVLSQEAPVVLSHRFSLGLARRPATLETTWAATVHARNELWQVLYPRAAETTTAGSTGGSSTSGGRGGSVSVIASAGSETERRAALLCLLPDPLHAVICSDRGITSTASSHPEEQQRLLRVMRVLSGIRQLFQLCLFESLDHILVAVSGALLRIGEQGYNGKLHGSGRHGAALADAQVFKRQRADFSVMLVMGTRELILQSSALWDGHKTYWQLQQLFEEKKPDEAATALRLPLGPTAMAASFSYQWAAQLALELPLISLRSRQRPDEVLANARVVLRVLEDCAAGKLPLTVYAKQISLASLLSSVYSLSIQWRNQSDAAASVNATVARTTTPARTTATEIDRADIIALYEGLLSLLRADINALLLSSYAAFLTTLYDAHLRLKADHNALIQLGDDHIFPTVLPFLTQALSCSCRNDSAATHFELCGWTLSVLSSLSRYAANPQVSMSDVLRSRWNEALLQVSTYCIRLSGRGGLKRAADFGLPPASLPHLCWPPANPTALVSPLVQFIGAEGHESRYLHLLHHSNGLLAAYAAVGDYEEGQSDSIQAALRAYVATWQRRVCFEVVDVSQREGEDRPLGTAAELASLASTLQRCNEASQCFASISAPATTAGAEMLPFIAERPRDARHLGYLIRFIEHYLREQERLSRLSSADLKEAMSTAWATGAKRHQGRGESSSALAVVAESTVSPTLTDATPLVLLEFVGYLCNGGSWAMVTWACNIAETVVKIELKRHRHTPEAARMVASTAFLSQLRAVPLPTPGSTLAANLMKSLHSLSDIMSSVTESLFGFYRRSPVQGLLSNPTRDEYQVLVFGVKQAAMYLQLESRKYRGARRSAETLAADAEVGEEEELEVGADAPNAAVGSDLVTDTSPFPSSVSLSRFGVRHGYYYAKVWSQRAAVAAGNCKDLNRELRFFLSCLVSCFDTSIESARLYLKRQQGDGEEDIQQVLESTIAELCRIFIDCIDSFNGIPRDIRQQYFLDEQAELLWVSLCVVATISAVFQRDASSSFFSLRGQRQVERLFQTVKTAMDEAVITAAEPMVQRPFLALAVRGVQLLLQDPRSTHRLSIRLGLRDRSRDDVTAVLTAFQVLVRAAAGYDRGRDLLRSVWCIVRDELVKSGFSQVPAAATRRKKTDKRRDAARVAKEEPEVASRDAITYTVTSRIEFEAVLAELNATCVELLSPAAPIADSRAGKDGGVPSSGSTPLCCDIAGASQLVLEVASREAHLRGDGQRKTSSRSHGDVESYDGDDGGEELLFTGETTDRKTEGSTSWSVSEVLENKAMTVNDVIDAVIAQSIQTVRAAGGRSSFDTIIFTPSGALEETTAVGFPRLLQEYRQNLMELLQSVPLSTISSRPQAEAIFGSLTLFYGADLRASPATSKSPSPSVEANEALWNLLFSKWKEELLDTWEQSFLEHQKQLLSAVRIHRTLKGDPSNTEEHDACGAVQDPFALPLSNAAEARPPVVTQAARQMWLASQWQPESPDLLPHDDIRLTATHGRGKEACNVAGLVATATPPLIPIGVALTLLKTLLRYHGVAHPLGSAPGSAGGGMGSNTQSPFQRLVSVVVTYVARSYWMLRPRLEDHLFDAYVTVERSMSSLTADDRQEEWERVCRQWRLPLNMKRAKAVAGELFSSEQQHRLHDLRQSSGDIKAASQSSGPGREEESEEVFALRYIQATALYMHLLSLAIALMYRHRFFGSLADASVDAVRRRKQLQPQHREADQPSTSGSSASAKTWTGRVSEQSRRDSHVVLSKESIQFEIHQLALERQTVPRLANLNLLEGAALHYFNVARCLLRHSDAITRTSLDRVVEVAALPMAPQRQSSGSQGTRKGADKSGAGAPGTSRSATPLDFVAYADEIRLLVAGVTQDSIDVMLTVAQSSPISLASRMVHALLNSGFSCDPLSTVTDAGDYSSASGALSAKRRRGPAAAAAPASHRSREGAGKEEPPSNTLSTTRMLLGVALATPGHVAGPARPELLVGSPTLLTVLSPLFFKRSLSMAIQGYPPGAVLGPITSALYFHLTRRDAPLAPILEATTELLTCCSVRNSAVNMYCERLATDLIQRKELRQSLAPPTIASIDQGTAGSIPNEVLLSFIAAMARQDVRVTKKTLAHLLHTVMQVRLDVFGQPPTANRQGKLTLVQVGTTVDSTIDTTNPLYTPKAPPKKGSRGSLATAELAGAEVVLDAADDAVRDAQHDATVMQEFRLHRRSDVTAMTHRKALAALSLTLPTVLELAMHMDAMRTLDGAETRRAMKMLKAADDARRERVAVHRSQVQAATQQGHKKMDADNNNTVASEVQQLDASLHLEDPMDFGVAILHLRYALRKVVHASLRRLLHQQGPRMLGDVAAMLQLVDPSFSREDGGLRGTTIFRATREVSKDVGSHPFDGVLTGTTRVLLSRAIQCAQAVGYDATGSALPLIPATVSQRKRREGTTADVVETPRGPYYTLQRPAPSLQSSALTASAAAAEREGVFAATDVVPLTREETIAVEQHTQLEREAAMAVGTSSVVVPRRTQQRIMRALRLTRIQKEMRHWKLDRKRHRGPSSPLGSSSP